MPELARRRSMDEHCTALYQMIERHRNSLTTDDQRETFQYIENVFVRTYMPAATIISNPFQSKTSKEPKKNNKKRKIYT